MKQRFSDWFNEKLLVRGYPIIEEIEVGGKYSQYEVFVNVSDELYFDYATAIRQLGKDYYWFPMGENTKDMGINSMFGALQVLHSAYKANKHAFLHCHAGANRSPTVKSAFYFMITGEHEKDGRFTNTLKLNAGRHLPELPKIENWLHKCREAFDNPEKFIGGMYDWTLMESKILK